MNIKSKLSMITGVVLVSGALLAGAAFANTPASTAEKAEQIQKAVTEGKLSQAEADLLTKLNELRTSYMEKLQTESKAILDKAVADGKITPEQADNLLKKGGHGMKGGPGGKGRHGFRADKGAMGEFRGPAFHAKSLEQVKADLEARVKEGKLTQEQADQALKHWEAEAAKSK